LISISPTWQHRHLPPFCDVFAAPPFTRRARSSTHAAAFADMPLCYARQRLLLPFDVFSSLRAFHMFDIHGFFR